MIQDTIHHHFHVQHSTGYHPHRVPLRPALFSGVELPLALALLDPNPNPDPALDPAVDPTPDPGPIHPSSPSS